jgi:NAD(P)-dependent dehydrogenase (short-subunit alcohol dehydrogenase family)
MVYHERPVALVTGANRGIGRQVARELAGLGHTVLLGSRDPARGARAADELRADGLDVVPLRLDVTDEPGVRAAAESIRTTYGRLDVLVNNAGTLAARPALAVTGTALRRTFEVNVIGPATAIRVLLPLLRESPAPRIVNVSSTTASLTLTTAGRDFGATGDFLDYATSKTALNMLTVQYAKAFAADPALAHVRINAVTPGFVATELNGFRGTRTVEQGARVVVAAATLAADGPTGTFVNDAGPVPW